MRKIVYLIALFCTSFFYAQTSGITYQAVIYYPNGQNIPGVDIQKSPMSNKSVCLQFSLTDDQSQLEYQEVIQTTTDEFGMVNLIIGSGNQTGGYASSFNAIVWNANIKKLKVQLDVNGACQQFVVLSDNPLSAVPFAYAAVTANSVSGVVSIQNGGTGASNLAGAKINLQIDNVDNTSDSNKPISIATQAALDTKENSANKSTTTTLGTSDVLFPTQNAVKTYVDTNITTVNASNTALQATVTANATAASTAIAAVQADVDANETAANTALALKENSANKSTTTALGTSDVLFPTQNAVKTYVDTNITTVNANNTALQATVTANATAANTALALKENSANKSTTTALGTSDVLFPTQNAVKTYVDTNITSVNANNTALQATVTANATASNTALALKENSANKSTTTALGTSDVLFPTQNAVKTYVDAQVASATIADADASTKGKIQLTGDLGGTAGSPTVPGLLNKENSANKSTITTLGTSDVLFPTQNAVKTYVDTNITTVNSNNTALQATVTANATAAATAIAAVQADVDANETAANTALALKENSANKSTTITLGTSDVLFPTQNAVKTYVDAQVASATIADADASTKGKIQLTGDLGGTAGSPTVPGLLNKENSANKSTTTTLGTSDVLFPTQNAVKTYVDAQVASATIADADASTKGKIQLTGDLGGTAGSPTVPGLLNKENSANKSTITTLGTSDVFFPTQNAVKTYVDTNITTVNANNTALQTTVTANATASATAIAAVQADVDANETAANTALALKENSANKSTTTTLGTSDVLFPTQNAVKTYVDTNITTVNANNTALQTTVTANATAASTAIAAVQADVDANETAANTALALKENSANKSITTTLGTSDVLFPTQNAVKTYVDTNITTVNSSITSLQATVTSNATSATTSIATVQADVDANETAANTALALKENSANKTLDLTTVDGTSDIKFPSAKATKDYVDSQISTGVVDASTTVKGKVQLAGDLTGIATAPEVAAGKITTIKLANDAVTTAKITNGNVTTAKLADDAVETVKIKNANVTNAKLATGIDATKLADGSVTNTELQYIGTLASDAQTQIDALSTAGTTNTTAITAINTLDDGKIYLGNASNVATEVTPTGDVTITNAGVTAIGTGKVVTAMLATDAVTTAKITNGNVTTAKLADDAVETVKIKNANVTNAKLATGIDATKLADGSVTNTELQYIGTLASDAQTQIDALSTAGTTNTTAITAINTLDDGKIYLGNASNVATEVTPTGDVTITNAGVTAIGTGKVVTAMLATDAVTTAKLADDAVETVKIKNANVTTAKLADDAVETVKIKNANVTNAKLAAGIDATKLADGSVTNTELQYIGTLASDAQTQIDALSTAGTTNTTAITAINTLDDGKIYLGNASNVATEVTPTGDVTITNAGVTAIGTSKVVNAMLATDAVTTAKITNGNVTTAKLADDAVETAKIKNANVTNAKLDKSNIPLSGFAAAAADVNLGSNKLTNVTDPTTAQDAATKNYVDTATSGITTLDDGKIYLGNASNVATEVTPTGDVTITNAGVTAIGTSKVVNAMLATDAVTTAKITNGNVTTAKLADDAVETAKIKNANVTNAKLDKSNIPLSGFAAASADVDLGSNKLTNVTDPTTAQDAATKNYVDTATSGITTLDDGKIYLGNASNVATEVTPTGDVTITNAGVTAIGTSKVVNAMLATDAVTTAKITNGNVTTAKLADDAVETAKIKNANVTYAKIQNVSATDKVLGRVSSGAGVIEEIATTGSGDVVRATSPTLVTPVIGAATGTSLSLTGQLTSTVATGTAPLVVTSTTPVANLNIGGNAATATTATNIAGGAAGSIPYQTAAATTALLPKGTDGQVLTLASGLPSWVTSSGVTTLSAINNSGTANGATITGSTLNLNAATATYGGVVTIGTQTFEGAKTFNQDLKVNGLTIGKGPGNTSFNYRSVALGVNALAAQTLGEKNVAIGYDALKTTTTGSESIAIGAYTLDTQTTGGSNIAIGSQALQDLTTSYSNIAIGGGALSKVTTANSNIGIGSSSGSNLTTGEANIMIGPSAGLYYGSGTDANTTGNNSIFIGFNARPAANNDTNEVVIAGTPLSGKNIGQGSNTTTIGNEYTSKAVIFGSTSLSNLPTTATAGNGGNFTLKAQDGFTTGNTNGGNIILTPGMPNGTGTAGQVQVAGQIKITGGTPGAGKVLTSDTNGLASWVAPVGVTTMAAIGSTPNANGATISGVNLNLQPASASFGGVVTTGTQAFAGDKTFNSDISVNENKFGRGAGSTGSRNIAIGINPLNSNTTGTWNTAVGAYALQLNTTSSSNTAIGNEAISNAIPGNNNTGIGSRALMNTTGSSNTAVGSNALLNASTGIDNTAIGKDALQGNTTGSNNIGIGVVAGANTTTGEYNIAIGKQALQQNTTGSTNVAVGAGAIDFITTGNNNTVLGGFAGRYAGTGTSTNTTTLNNSMLLGYDTRPKLNSDSNEIVIGNGTVGNGSNTTTIGNANTTDTYIYGNLNVTGQIKLNNAVLSKSATYSFLTTDNANLLVFTGSTAGQTITLPSAVTAGAGREITIKNIASVSVSVASAGGTLISDSTTTAATILALGIEPSNNWVKAISDGTNWIILRGLF